MISTMPKSPVVLVLIFFVVLFIALGASRYTETASANTSADALILVETLGENGVQPGELKDRYIARVNAAQRVELGFDIASVITRIYKREGEVFTKGELLAELDIRRLSARKAELEASLERADAMLALAQTSLKRVRGLRTNGNVSEQALDEALRTREAAVADKKLVEAQLDSVALEIEKSKLIAPFNGVVIDRLSDEGRTVSLGLPVLRIEESSRPEVRVSLPLDIAKSLVVGASVALQHNDERLSGKVERINLSLSQSRVSEVYLAVPSQDTPLVPGEILHLELPRDLEDSSASLHTSQTKAGAVWLPTTALAEYGRGLWSVYLAEPDAQGEAQLRRTIVEIDQIQGNTVLVRGGVTPALRAFVVKDATHRAVVGQKVRVCSAEPVVGAR